jgi:hypothetical protein
MGMPRSLHEKMPKGELTTKANGPSAVVEYPRCLRAVAALRLLKARPRGGRRLERTYRLNGPPSRTMLLGPSLRPEEKVVKLGRQGISVLLDTCSHRVRCLSIPNDMGIIHIVVDVQTNGRVHRLEDNDVPLRIEAIRSKITTVPNSTKGHMDKYNTFDIRTERRQGAPRPPDSSTGRTTGRALRGTRCRSWNPLLGQCRLRLHPWHG